MALILANAGGTGGEIEMSTLEHDYYLANSTNVPKSFTCKKGDVIVISRGGSNKAGNVTISSLVNCTIIAGASSVTGSYCTLLQATADGTTGATIFQAISSDIYVNFDLLSVV